MANSDVYSQFSQQNPNTKSYFISNSILIWETAFDLICSWQKMKVWLWWQQDTIVITYSDHLTSVTRVGIPSALPHWCENMWVKKGSTGKHRKICTRNWFSRPTGSPVFCSSGSSSISTHVSWGVSYFELIRQGQSPLAFCSSGFEAGPHCVGLAAPKLPL